jgi:phytanoyl-CoA hydroxylase
MIRRLKILYAVYNLFHRKQLAYNIALYKKLGLKKAYFSPVSSKDFRHVDGNLLREEVAAIQPSETAIYLRADEETRRSISDYDRNGYLVLKNHLTGEQVDAINREIDAGLKDKRLTFRYRNKIMFAINQIELLKNVGTDPDLLSLLSSLTGGEMRLFQSINFLAGSEQKTHSDSIHMTTFPLGGLLGVWIALEDIESDNGPLHYYPGSHKLPYYLNSDYNNEGNAFLIGAQDYTEYEKMIEQKIAESGLNKEIFLARKGDVLVWHANLFHGGEPHLNKAKTRKSMVLHYYKTHSICYHEVTQRPALMK